MKIKKTSRCSLEKFSICFVANIITALMSSPQVLSCDQLICLKVDPEVQILCLLRSALLRPFRMRGGGEHPCNVSNWFLEREISLTLELLLGAIHWAPCVGTRPSFKPHPYAVEIAELPGLSDVHHLSVRDLMGIFLLGRLSAGTK